ncbi:MipA/OmpV family protein [Sphingobium sp. DC-2]|uniref:MipA/OmpV family protein n=1 Tax=Sphingobium sp. DC-2 TaxID=1303256 RepID=UPI0004C46F78|nr:MipA/OmpV family protein [Sphingobium sp. DC-2]
MTRYLQAAVALAMTLAPSVAGAQDIADPAREQVRQSADRFIVGVGVAATPARQGGDDYRVLPIPMIDIVSGPFFVNLRNGVGVKVIDTPGFAIGGSVTIMPGYRRQDVPEGIDRYRVGAGGRLFATVNAGGALLSVGGTQGFAGSTKGTIADVSVSYPVVASERLVVIPALVATWANKKHNDRYFGISSRESVASGLPEYRLGSGFKDVSIGITANYRLTDRINLSASGGVTRLVGDAKDSPLVEKKTQPTGFLALSYLIGR